MKRFYFLTSCLLAGATSAFSQASNCTQVLRLVRTTYEQGRLHELPGLTEGCLRGTGIQGFNKEERKEAYRYLTLSYIYLEEPEKADEMMLQLLSTDHFYQPNQDVDPAEFIALYNKFRHDPLFRIAIKFGSNLTQPVASRIYNIGSAGAAKGKYAMSPSFQVSLAFEKDITKKLPLVLVAELGYISRSYSYTNGQLATADEDPTMAISTQEFVFTQNFLDLNVIGQYKFKNTIALQTYVGGGPGISYLLSSSNQATTLLGNGFTVTGLSVDDINSYNKLLVSAMVVAGIKYKFGEVYVTAEARYQMGFTDVVKSSSRTNPEIAFDYQGRYNDYKINNFMLNLGVTIPYFKPKKLIK
ncbi:MAG: outer membrane beta-barrel protein [Cytophagales bacterium]|nr:outer membrane beta-barrel protein [Cytophagales bacterium]